MKKIVNVLRYLHDVGYLLIMLAMCLYLLYLLNQTQPLPGILLVAIGTILGSNDKQYRWMAFSGFGLYLGSWIASFIWSEGLIVWTWTVMGISGIVLWWWPLIRTLVLAYHRGTVLAMRP